MGAMDTASITVEFLFTPDMPLLMSLDTVPELAVNAVMLTLMPMLMLTTVMVMDTVTVTDTDMDTMVTDMVVLTVSKLSAVLTPIMPLANTTDKRWQRMLYFTSEQMDNHKNRLEKV